MAMDQQAAMERLRELYREKNEHLEKFLEPVTPFEFYREISPVGSFERKGHYEDEKGNGIAVTVPPKAAGIALEVKDGGKAKHYTITDELSELSEVFDTDFTIMSPLSYFGWRRCGKNARYLYALVFDLDGVGMPQLRAVEALKNGEWDIEEMRESYDQRRRYLMRRFREMGLPCFEPHGAFYCFPNIKRFVKRLDQERTAEQGSGLC